MAIPKMEVNLKELDELFKRIEGLDKETKEKLTDEIFYTALFIESDAKKSCPVVTGRLRSSIRALFSREPISAVIGTPVEYAELVEYGSRELNRRAKPYLYPAYFKNIAKLKETLENAIGR
jgi:hypothetical protein